MSLANPPAYDAVKEPTNDLAAAIEDVEVRPGWFPDLTITYNTAHITARTLRPTVLVRVPYHNAYHNVHDR
jgi:hypothetical protein